MESEKKEKSWIIIVFGIVGILFIISLSCQIDRIIEDKRCLKDKDLIVSSCKENHHCERLDSCLGYYKNKDIDVQYIPDYDYEDILYMNDEFYGEIKVQIMKFCWGRGNWERSEVYAVKILDNSNETKFVRTNYHEGSIKFETLSEDYRDGCLMN